ncbi:MAG: transglutaminase family protein [Pseudomonadota bacterium]
MDTSNGSFDAAIHAHDAAVAASGLEIWIGAEPTFTNRHSEAPEWLTDALGPSKQGYAWRIIEDLRAAYPGALILRTLGRQYPDESEPRWSLGLYRRRDGRALADGLPGDPLDRAVPCDLDRSMSFWACLAAVLDRDGWSAHRFSCTGDMPLRIVFRCDGRQPQADPQTDTRLARASWHGRPLPPEGVADALAAGGDYLVTLGVMPVGTGEQRQPCIELPAFTDVATFLSFVQRVAQAASTAGLTALVWRGCPPPVDSSVAWTTLTPDPAVLEINEAPAATVSEFLGMSRRLYAVAAAAGLRPYRLQYNGGMTDSGGGGQFTLGGPSPARSPFFAAPRLLQRLVVYLNHHPALSYWFAPPSIGSCSQSPRADENVRESISELQLALRRLAAAPEPAPELLWRSLSPFLVDSSGNSHRSEINIEKLWNPYLPGRGCLGLVELRALRMAVDAETAAAIAALWRALAAMLVHRDTGWRLVDWGGDLHDRFALPFYLRRDLAAVLDDLAESGLGLGAPLAERLFAADWRQLGHASFAGCEFSVEQAVEFWPLLGDVAQHSGGSRLVDASTTRLQLMLRPASGRAADLEGWQLRVGHYSVPMQAETDAAGALRLTGLRYRAFVPWTGLHPGLDAQGPIELMLLPPDGTRALRVTLHDWQPQGLAYPGLPGSVAAAARRRRERCVAQEVAAERSPGAGPPPAEALSAYCFDLRCT